MTSSVGQLLPLLCAAAAESSVWEGSAGGWEEDTTSVFANPGMGFSKWSAYPSPEPHPVVSHVYDRFTWRDLEPATEGVYDFSAIDSWIRLAADRNLTSSGIRIMAEGEGNETVSWVPEWLVAKLPDKAKYHSLGGERVVDFSNEIVREGIRKLVVAMGERYDRNPLVDFVDIGAVGCWGEWHTLDGPFPVPAWNITKQYIDWHFDAFPSKPLVMLIGPSAELEYAVGRGAGVRADCLGDMSDGWNHMHDFYPVRFNNSVVRNGWKKAPVVFESCWTLDDWLDRGWNLSYIVDKALEWHVTSLNNKNGIVPTSAQPEVDRLLRHMGYRLVLVRAFARVDAVSGRVSVSSSWRNVGVAPPYYPMTLTYRIVGGTGRVLWNGSSSASLKTWLPAAEPIVQDDSFGAAALDLKDDQSPRLEVGIFNGANGQRVDLAIKGAGRHGDYYVVLNLTSLPYVSDTSSSLSFSPSVVAIILAVLSMSLIEL